MSYGEIKIVEVVIRLPQNLYIDVKNGHASNIQRERVIEQIKNGTVLPVNHGKIVDLSNIDKDRIEQDNPIITININDTEMEVVSLDYLNNLPDLTKKEEQT